MNLIKPLKSILVILTVCSIVFTGSTQFVAAAKSELTLEGAIKLALQASADYKKQKNKIILEEAKYTAAVKKIKAKQKSMSSFRWSPLLSFKFPEKPFMDEAHSWEYKPVQIQSKINGMRHKLSDIQLGTAEKVELLYAECYTLQEKIKFLEESYDAAVLRKEKNEALLMVGKANKKDIDIMQKKLDALNLKIAQNKRLFRQAKAKLSDKLNLNVEDRYIFVEPFHVGIFPREDMQSIIDFTLDNSQSYYEAKLETSLCRKSVDLYLSLFARYGSDMNIIRPYIERALAGGNIDSAAFKISYNEFLEKIDSYWTGKKKILVFKFPKLWFKGEQEGQRYISDDPMALYTSVLEYQDAAREEKSVRKEIEDQVKEHYETTITLKNAYESLRASKLKMDKELEKAKQRNLIGDLSLSEYLDMVNERDELNISTLEALKDYSNQLCIYNRYCCGGIYKYLAEGSLPPAKADGSGMSYVELAAGDKPYYTIESRVEDNLFALGVHAPDGVDFDYDEFSLIVDGIQVGGLTSIEDSLVHLSIDLDRVEKAQIILYKGGEKAASCDIDPYTPFGILEGLQGEKETVMRKEILGKYKIDRENKFSRVRIYLEIDNNAVKYYRILYSDGTPILSKELIPIKNPFVYRDIVAADMGILTLELYDKGGKKLMDCAFDSLEMTLVKKSRVR